MVGEGGERFPFFSFVAGMQFYVREFTCVRVVLVWLENCPTNSNDAEAERVPNFCTTLEISVWCVNALVALFDVQFNLLAVCIDGLRRERN